jgi:hypothetical protein
MSKQLERMWTEVIIAWFGLLPGFSGGTDKSGEILGYNCQLRVQVKKDERCQVDRAFRQLYRN